MTSWEVAANLVLQRMRREISRNFSPIGGQNGTHQKSDKIGPPISEDMEPAYRVRLRHGRG
jgi:hypothetical protein